MLPRWLPLIACTIACNGAPTRPVADEPLRFAPGLNFEDTYVGASRTLGLTFENPAQHSVELSFSFNPPFSGPATVVVSAGSGASVAVTFTPLAAGNFNAALAVGDQTVSLSGIGRAPLDCQPNAACHTTRFNPEFGRCDTSVLPEATDCTSSDLCFVRAECRAGECVGTLTRCDDSNPCTLDACGASGCIHADAIYTCAESSNPCLVPSCDPKAGCGFVDAPDGTSCGVRDCSHAKVCMLGSCVERPAPPDQACVEVVAGLPGSAGSIDGVGDTARFMGLRLAVDSKENIWVADPQSVRKVTPGGVVTTVAGVNSEAGSADGSGLRARFVKLNGIAIDSKDFIYLADDTCLRKMSTAGWVTTLAGVPRAASASSASIDGVGSAARFNSTYGIEAIAASDDGYVWVSEGRTVRRVSPLGEVTTLFGNSGIIYASNLAAYLDGVVWFTRNGLVAGFADGGVQTISPQPPPYFFGGLAGRAGQIFISNLGGSGEISELTTSTTVLKPAWMAGLAPSRSGTLYALALGGDFAWTGDSPVVNESFSTITVVAVDAGVSKWLAGPPLPEAVADGPAPNARFRDPWAVWTTESSIGVSDRPIVGNYYHAQIREIANGQVATRYVSAVLGGDDFAWDVAVGPQGFWAAGSNSIIQFQQLSGPQTVMLTPPAQAPQSGLDLFGDDSVVIANRDSLLRFSPDAGFSPLAEDAGLVEASDVLFTRDGGFWVANGSTLLRLTTDGAWAKTVGGPRGNVDGPASAARFEKLWGLAASPTGDLFATDLGNRSIRRITPAGDVSTVARLADPPRQLTVEDGGSILVTVPRAVLRIKLQ